MSAFTIADVPIEVSEAYGPVERLGFPTQGMTSQTAFCAGPRSDFVLKRCDDPRYVDWLRREHAVLDALRDSDLPIPRVLTVVDRASDVWLAITKLPGIPLGQALRDTDADSRAQLLSELGALLGRIHVTPLPAALHDEVPWVDRMLAQAERNLAWCDGTRGLLDELRARRPDPMPESLIHGDLGLDNVLVAGGHVSGMVDWPMGGSGDCRFDLAIAIEHDEELPFDETQLDAFWDGYGASPLDLGTCRWFRRLWDFF